MYLYSVEELSELYICHTIPPLQNKIYEGKFLSKLYNMYKS